MTALFWADEDVANSINETYGEISDATEWYERSTTINLLSNRMYYDLRTNLSSTILSPGRCFNTQTSRWLDPACVRDFDNNSYRQWETIQGQPSTMFTRGLWWFGVTPIASADSGTIKLYYTAIPADLSADSDEPGFPQEFHYALVVGTISDLLAQERETAKALQFWKEYAEYEAALGRYVGGRVKLDRVSGFRE